MGRPRNSPAAVVVLVLLALVVGVASGYRLGLNRNPDSREGDPEPQKESEAQPVREEGPTAETMPIMPAPRNLGITLADLDAEDAGARARARQVLREAGYDDAAVVRAVIRPTRPEWRGRALADLLSENPDATLPPLLHRLTHAAPVHRAEICRALGAHRENPTPASVVLTVRALLDCFDDVRESAWASLESVDPTAAEAVAAHYRKGFVLADGSAAGLDASLLIEPGGPYMSGTARRMFVDALRAEGARFGPPTLIRVGAFLAPLPGGEVWLEDAMRLLLSSGSLDGEAVGLLSSVGPYIVPLLRQRLLEPDAPEWVAITLGNLGPRAADAVPDLLQIVVEGRPTWRSALRATVRLASSEAEEPNRTTAAESLSPVIHDAEMGMHVAWALGELGASSPAVLDALGVRLVHRLARGRSAIQAEGALLRLLAQGHGFGHVAELLESDHQAVRRAAIRILALCHARDREAAQTLLAGFADSAVSRAVRRTAERGLALLSRAEEVREAERRWRISSLDDRLEWE